MIKSLLNVLKLLTLALGGFFFMMFVWAHIDNYLSDQEEAQKELARIEQENQAEHDRVLAGRILNNIYKYSVKADDAYNSAVRTIGNLKFSISRIRAGISGVRSALESIKLIRDRDTIRVRNDAARAEFRNGTNQVIVAYNARLDYLIMVADAMETHGPIGVARLADTHQHKTTEYEKSVIAATFSFMQAKLNLGMKPDLIEWQR